MTNPTDQLAHRFTIKPHRAARQDHFQIGDNPLRDRLRQPGRAAHRQHHVADGELGTITELGNRQRHVRIAEVLFVDLEHRQISQRISADQSRPQFLAIRQIHHDATRATGNVVVGDDVAVGMDDGSRTTRPLLLHPAAATFLGNHVNADQRGIDGLDRSFNLRINLRG